MNALNSPLEALALDYMSFGFLTVVNNVWTWVAVITAAVSVWRIRTSSPRDQCGDPAEVSLVKPVSTSPVNERVVAEAPPAATSSASSTKVEAPPRPSTCVFNSEGRTSGKFTFYYDQVEEEEVGGEGNVDGDVDVDGGDGNGERIKDGWEIMMEMRMGDHMGFYRYQDLTVLDGNVVRLWDGCRRKNVNVTPLTLVRCGGSDW